MVSLHAVGWVVAVASLALCVAALLLRARNSQSSSGPSDLPIADVWLYLWAPIVGAYLWGRAPGSWVGLVLMTGAVGALGAVAREYATFAVDSGTGLPGAAAAAWLSTWTWVPIFAVPTLLALFYPDAHRVWPRPLLVAVLVDLVVVVLLSAVHPGHFAGAPSVVNPLGIQAAPWLDTALSVVLGVTVLVLVPVCLVTVVIRWRRASGTQRYRLGWFVGGYAVFVVSFVVPAGSGVWADVVTAIGLTALFASIAVGTAVAGITERLGRERQELMVAREGERLRLHRDLHDGVGPELAGVALQLSALASSVQDPVLRGRLVGLQERLRGAVGEVRRAVEDLRPPALDELGLVGALRARAESFTAPGVFVCTFEAAELPPMSSALEVAVWRITTEAVSNAARHSQATHCFIRLRAGGGGAALVEVEDDGTGVPSSARRGVGMDSMRARARELGGELQVLPRIGGGTLVRATLPGAA